MAQHEASTSKVAELEAKTEYDGAYAARLKDMYDRKVRNLERQLEK